MTINESRVEAESMRECVARPQARGKAREGKKKATNLPRCLILGTLGRVPNSNSYRSEAAHKRI
jgi:hypothetical protein